jgi:SAM-dependent methyltransferase
LSKSRQPHAVLDLPSRRLKGMKIEQLLALPPRLEPYRLLEIGTGSGGIAHYFGVQAIHRYDVTAVDVVDQRLVHDGYRYVQVAGAALPFEDRAFDVVVTNHVIEHVGDEAAQLAHLQEVRRVLKPEGVGYLAVPNRWMLVEPHFRLPFLSWLPRGWRTPYLQAARRGRHYDCEPLTLREAETLLTEASLAFENVCVPAWRATLDIEQPRSRMAKCLKVVPDSCLTPLRPMIPTLIYRLKRA